MRPSLPASTGLLLLGLLGSCSGRKAGGSNPSEYVAIPTAVCRRGEVHLAGTATVTAVPRSPNNESKFHVTAQIDCAGKPVPHARLEVEYLVDVMEYVKTDEQGRLATGTSRFEPIPPGAKVILRVNPGTGVAPIIQEIAIVRQ